MPGPILDRQGLFDPQFDPQGTAGRGMVALIRLPHGEVGLTPPGLVYLPHSRQAAGVLGIVAGLPGGR